MELFWELYKGMYAFSLTKSKLDSTLCLLTCCVVFDVCELKVFVFLSHYMVWFQRFTVADFNVVTMSSLSRELVFLMLQLLDEENFKETVHKWG
jgi:hypothetical protein